MQEISKDYYFNLVEQALITAGGTIIRGSQTQFRCQLDGRIYRIFLRYRRFPENESQLTHFSPDAFDNLISKTPTDEIPCLANVGHYLLNGREQIILFVIELNKIFSLEVNGVSNIFSIGPKTNRHIIKQPQTLSDELELISESIIFNKLVLPVHLSEEVTQDEIEW